MCASVVLSFIVFHVLSSGLFIDYCNLSEGFFFLHNNFQSKKSFLHVEPDQCTTGILVVLQVSSYFCFSQLKGEQKEKRWRRKTEEQRRCACDGRGRHSICSLYRW